MLRLVPVTPGQRTLLYNLNQKYLYEMTNYYPDPLDEEGNLHYGHFEEYFTDPRREALFLYDEGALVGFAMVIPYSNFGGGTDHVMAEFTVFPMYRRRGLAARAAEAIFEGRPGRWEVKFNEKNAAARALWTRATARYMPEARRFSEDETVLCFEVKQ